MPVAAKFQVEYTSKSSFGAVLVALPPIRRERYYFTVPFKHWANTNASALIKMDIWDDIKSSGLCIITQTYATPKYTFTACNETGKAVYLGFEAEVKGAGDLNASS
jgi:hypothetical protein